MEPLVSVIIPTYNRAGYLSQTLKSVLEQTYRDIEVIVVDDGSTDNTTEVVASFNDSRIRYLKQDHRGLPAIGRNTGLKAASGDYIAFLDDDDLWMPEKIEKQLDYLSKHPEYTIMYSNAWFIDENGVQNGLVMKPKYLKEGDIFEELIWGSPKFFIPQLTVLMKRKVFENIGFFNEDPSMRFIEDYEYWLRASLRYKIGFIDELLAMYREHSQGGGLTVNYGKLGQKVLYSLINDPLVPNKDKVIERIHDLYFKSAICNWRDPNKSAARDDLKKYLSYSIQRMSIINLFKGMCLWILINLAPPKFYTILCNLSRKI